MPETETEKDDDVVLEFLRGPVFRYRDSIYKNSNIR